MQKFRMLKHARGVHDGQLHPVEFHKGQTYDIGEKLADQFIEMGAVEMVGDDAEEKSKGDAPENKAKKAAPENKSKS